MRKRLIIKGNFIASYVVQFNYRARTSRPAFDDDDDNADGMYSTDLLCRNSTPITFV